MRSERINKLLLNGAHNSVINSNNTMGYNENSKKLVNNANNMSNNQGNMQGNIKNSGIVSKPMTRSMSANNVKISTKLAVSNENISKVGNQVNQINSKDYNFAERQMITIGKQEYYKTLHKVLSVDMLNSDPSYFSEYAEVIYQTSRDKELNQESLWFTASQVIVAQPSVGKQILDWKKSGVNLLFGLQITFNVPDEVTVMANSMLDRILGLKHFQRASEMTLVSATCFWVALKYEAAYVQGENPKIPPLPALSDVAEKCGLNVAAILFCEGVVLEALDWCIEFPKPCDYIKRFCLVFKDQYTNNKSSRVESLSIYLSHLAIHEPAMMGVSPSKLACACLMLAHKIEGVEESWAQNIEYYSGYTRESLKELTRYMISNLRTIRNTENGESHASPSHYQNVRRKWWNSWGSNEWG
ncbi:cyclin, N-terminal domain-containing protein [Cryptosporidium serpentis]